MGVIENLAKNPAVLGIAAVGIIAFIFKDKISDFLSNISGGAATANILGENLLSNLQGTQNLLKGVNDFFTDFKLPEFPTFEFPTFEFPTFEFPTFEFPKIFGEPEPVGTPVDQALAAGATPQDIAAMLTPEEIALDPNQDPTKFLPPALPQEPTIVGTQPTSIIDFVNNFLPKPQLDVQSAIPDQQFQGGGVSFEGGFVSETPIENLSLSQIIDKFMVSASKAADIKAQAIGFTPEEQAFLNQGQEISPLGDIASQPAVSDPQFQGLTPEEIVLKLTGGVISNF